MNSKKFFHSLPFLVLLLFFLLFSFRTAVNITTTTFNDYDEAHRAEGARNMRLNHYFLTPLVGGPYNRPNENSQPYSQDNTKKITPEKGRPPLVFLLMAAASQVFGDKEWAYRLPSFIFGLISFAALYGFILFFEKKKPHLLSLSVALFSFLTAYDWWHSSQMAHLDTGLSFFLAASIFSLLIFVQKRQRKFLTFSGVFLAGAILSKGQPAILFLLPLFYLLIIKKITPRQALELLATAGVVLLPWLIAFDLHFGWGSWFKTYFYSYAAHPAATKIGRADPTQSAPVFWYLRWWFDTFRPAIFLFGAFFLCDLFKKRFSWQKAALFSYIAGGMLLFSLSKSKVWWYVLPLIPAVSAYLYFSAKDYLLENKTGTANLSLAILLSSLPIFLFKTNTISLAYGIVSVLLVFVILNCKLENCDFIENCKLKIENLLPIVLVISSFSFYSHFPVNTPLHPEIKAAGQYYASLSGHKCLLIDEELPYEAALYYSRAGQVWYWLDIQDEPKKDCSYYLLSDRPINFGRLVYQNGPIRLYGLN